MILCSWEGNHRSYVTLARHHTIVVHVCSYLLAWQPTKPEMNTIGNKSVPKVIINDTINLFFLTAVSILLISNHNSFRVLFDKIASVYLKNIFIFQHWKWPAQGTGIVPIVLEHFCSLLMFYYLRYYHHQLVNILFFSVACDNGYQFNTVNTFIVATKQVLYSKLQIACHQKNF